MNLKSRISLIALLAVSVAACDKPAEALSTVEVVQTPAVVESAAPSPVNDATDWSNFVINGNDQVIGTLEDGTKGVYDGEITGVTLQTLTVLDPSLAKLLNDLQEYVGLNILADNSAGGSKCRGFVGSGWLDGQASCVLPNGTKTVDLSFAGGEVKEMATYHLASGKDQLVVEMAGARIIQDFSVYDDQGQKKTYPVEGGYILSMDAY